MTPEQRFITARLKAMSKERGELPAFARKHGFSYRTLYKIARGETESPTHNLVMALHVALKEMK